MTADPAIRERLRELAEKATPGPWFAQGPLVHGPDQGGWDIGPVRGWHEWLADDAALIVAMRNALPALLDELNTLERRAIAAERVADAALEWRDAKAAYWAEVESGPVVPPDVPDFEPWHRMRVAEVELFAAIEARSLSEARQEERTDE